jgi:hypothetical protein
MTGIDRCRFLCRAMAKEMNVVRLLRAALIALGFISLPLLAQQNDQILFDNGAGSLMVPSLVQSPASSVLYLTLWRSAVSHLEQWMANWGETPKEQSWSFKLVTSNQVTLPFRKTAE